MSWLIYSISSVRIGKILGTRNFFINADLTTHEESERCRDIRA